MKLRPVGAEFDTDRHTDRRAEVMKLIVTFRNSVYTPKNLFPTSQGTDWLAVVCKARLIAVYSDIQGFHKTEDRQTWPGVTWCVKKIFGWWNPVLPLLMFYPAWVLYYWSSAPYHSFMKTLYNVEIRNTEFVSYVVAGDAYSQPQCFNLLEPEFYI